MTERGSGHGVDAADIQSALDGKTKPPGALGRIEALAAQVAALQGTLTPQVRTARLIVFAADHGMAALSAFPQEVTRQMVANFVAGGAAACVFARSVGAEMTVVDAGVAGERLDLPGVVDRWQGPGTADARHGPAMTPATTEAAWDAGAALGAGIAEDAALFGEMGIGNTASAALLAAKLTGRPVAETVGRGTGLDDAGLAAKRAALEGAAARTQDRLPAMAALSEYGGYEIAMMAGAMVGAARAGRVVLVDGFIATAAAACALDRAPESRRAMVFAHLSAEAGHAALIEALGADPLLPLGMRLGEGTGALLALPLVRAAADMLREMASFADAGVSGAKG